MTDMRFYFTTKSIPEFEGLSPGRRRRIYQAAYKRGWQTWWMYLTVIPPALMSMLPKGTLSFWQMMAVILATGLLQNHLTILLVRRHIGDHLAEAHAKAVRKARGLRMSVRHHTRRRTGGASAPVARPRSR